MSDTAYPSCPAMAGMIGSTGAKATASDFLSGLFHRLRPSCSRHAPARILESLQIAQLMLSLRLLVSGRW